MTEASIPIWLSGPYCFKISVSTPSAPLPERGLIATSGTSSEGSPINEVIGLKKLFIMLSSPESLKILMTIIIAKRYGKILRHTIRPSFAPSINHS